MEKQSLSQQTARRLYSLIAAEKKLSPGEKLPNELELSQEMGISRATLREAIRELVTQGVLEVRRGRGTFVSQRVNEINDFGFSSLDQVRGQLRDLFELRAVFEPEMAALACRRASPEELEDILAQGERVAACIQAGKDRTQADRDFHAAIVRATHNEFMTRLLPVISQAVETAIVSSDQDGQLAQYTLQDHALLMEFFSKRDPDGTRHAMAVHMRHAMDEMGLDMG